MKAKLFVFLLSVILLSCQQKGKTYIARALKANEDLNQYQTGKGNALTIYKYGDSVKNEDGNETKERFGVKFMDTTVRVQTDAADKNTVIDQFTFAQFINTQKTSLLLQAADSSELVAPFYLISINHGKLDVISIYRPSDGKQDRRFTKGLEKIGRSGYLINNDYFITSVNAKIYPITRQKPEERIQGLHFVNSSDRKTLVFLMSSSLYEVHYPTGEVFTQPLPKNTPKQPVVLYKWIQDNYNWQKNTKGVSFLKENKDNDKIVDISEFK